MSTGARTAWDVATWKGVSRVGGKEAASGLVTAAGRQAYQGAVGASAAGELAVQRVMLLRCRRRERCRRCRGGGTGTAGPCVVVGAGHARARFFERAHLWRTPAMRDGGAKAGAADAGRSGRSWLRQEDAARGPRRTCAEVRHSGQRRVGAARAAGWCWSDGVVMWLRWRRKARWRGCRPWQACRRAGGSRHGTNAPCTRCRADARRRA